MEEPKGTIAGERPPAQAGTRADESADSSPCGAGKQAHVMEVAWHPAPYNKRILFEKDIEYAHMAKASCNTQQ